MQDWEKAVRENARVVVAVAQRILGNEHDAEDVAQDVFCEALRLVNESRVHDWPGMFRRLATLRSIDRLRKRKPTTNIEGLRSSEADPSEVAIERELATRLRESIAQLPQQQAAVFSLFFLEQLSRDEIATCLEISPEGVSTALHKARQRMKSILNISEASNGC